MNAVSCKLGRKNEDKYSGQTVTGHLKKKSVKLLSGIFLKVQLTAYGKFYHGVAHWLSRLPAARVQISARDPEEYSSLFSLR
jgi:hypothetical protein